MRSKESNSQEASTWLSTTVRIEMSTLPTGMYHLFNSTSHPLAVVEVNAIKKPESQHQSDQPVRLLVKARIDGISSEEVKFIYLDSDATSGPLNFLPALLPDKIRHITTTHPATLHIQVTDMNGTIEYHKSHEIKMLAHKSVLSSIRNDTDCSLSKDLTPFYGAWVTPNAEPILRLLTLAAARTKDKTIGYHSGQASKVTDQVRAIFDTIKSELRINFYNSTIDTFGMTGFNVRLPRESIEQRSANSLDGTILFASLLEAAALNAAIVLYPGHSIVAWSKSAFDVENESEDEILKNWEFLETTWIGQRTFEEAMIFARDQVERYIGRDDFVMHQIMNLRLSGIYPMA